jgi:hypothetical protein
MKERKRWGKAGYTKEIVLSRIPTDFSISVYIITVPKKKKLN